MNHHIAFLHTSTVHIPTFQKLIDDIDPSILVRHEVDESLLEDAVAHGITEQLGRKVESAMQLAASSGAEVVVCTCSSIGALAEKSLQTSACVSMRVDRAMADLAIDSSQRILIVAAVESTLEPTRLLLEESSTKIGKFPHLSIALVEQAWFLFEASKMDAYYDCIEKFIQVKHHGYDSIVLAQASMAPVAQRFQNSSFRVLASPELGARSAISHIQMKNSS